MREGSNSRVAENSRYLLFPIKINNISVHRRFCADTTMHCIENVSEPFFYLSEATQVRNRMAKHHPDLIFCRKQAGIGIGRLCEKHDGLCVICDSSVLPSTLVRVCDECNFGAYQGRCVVCGGPGISDAYYCKECTLQEKDVRRIPMAPTNG